MTPTPADTASATEIAADLESAGFVRVISRADGDTLAASGVVTRALADREVPFQVSVAPTIGERTDRARADTESEPGSDSEDEVTLVVGASDADGSAIHHLEPDDRPASLLACDLVAAFDNGGPDPVLALAGAFAAGVEPGAGETEWLLESAIDGGHLERRPGVAVPTDDVADGLAHTTLCRGPWSGDLEATRSMVATVARPSGSDDDASEDEGTAVDYDHKRLASCVALDVVGSDGASQQAATAIARVLRPHVVLEREAESVGGESDEPGGFDRPFTTIGGYADVLEGLARSAPGLGIAVTIGTTTPNVRERALEAWRDHGRRAHEALDDATTGRYDGLFVVGIDDGPVETVARLAAEYRSPEPLVLAIGDGEAAVAALDAHPLEGALEAVARDLGLGASYDVGRRRGYVRFDPDAVDDERITAAMRETL